MRRGRCRARRSPEPERDLRRRETLLIVLDEDAIGILVLRHEIDAGGDQGDGGGVIAHDVQVLRAVEEQRLRERAEMNSRDLLLIARGIVVPGGVSDAQMLLN